MAEDKKKITPYGYVYADDNEDIEHPFFGYFPSERPDPEGSKDITYEEYFKGFDAEDKDLRIILDKQDQYITRTNFANFIYYLTNIKAKSLYITNTFNNGNSSQSGLCYGSTWEYSPYLYLVDENCRIKDLKIINIPMFSYLENVKNVSHYHRIKAPLNTGIEKLTLHFNILFTDYGTVNNNLNIDMSLPGRLVKIQSNGAIAPDENAFNSWNNSFRIPQWNSPYGYFDVSSVDGNMEYLILDFYLNAINAGNQTAIRRLLKYFRSNSNFKKMLLSPSIYQIYQGLSSELTLDYTVEEYTGEDPELEPLPEPTTQALSMQSSPMTLSMINKEVIPDVLEIESNDEDIESLSIGENFDWEIQDDNDISGISNIITD